MKKDQTGQDLLVFEFSYGVQGKSSMKQLIVCDSGPIIHLYEAGILTQLRKTGDVFLPQGVKMEVLCVNRGYIMAREVPYPTPEAFFWRNF
jgi:hypothetical protein